MRTALAMADASPFVEATWGFHLQQAIEKALKGWVLVLSPEQPPFSHNLRLLFQMLRDQGAAVDPFVGLSRFTLFAVMWRSDEEPDVEHLDRTVWSTLCADLLDHVASQIPGTTPRPVLNGLIRHRSFLAAKHANPNRHWDHGLRDIHQRADLLAGMVQTLTEETHHCSLIDERRLIALEEFKKLLLHQGFSAEQ